MSRTLIGNNFFRTIACAILLAFAPPLFGAAPFVIQTEGPTPDEVKEVTVEEHLGASLPLDLVFHDEQGSAVPLRQFFSGKKPVVLQMGYYNCPMLCGLVSQGLIKSLKDVSLNAGSDYEVVYVSIDPNETPLVAAGKKQSYVKAYQRPARRPAGTC